MTEKKPDNQKLQKLYRLMKQGIGGEQVNAEEMFIKALDKYGMKIEDFEDEETPQDRYFNYKSELQKRLLAQIVFSVRSTEVYQTMKGGSRKIKTKLTRAEAAQVDVIYSVLNPLLKKELDIFMMAFISKHKIYSKQELQEGVEMTTEEFQMYRKARRMAEGMDSAHINKQIGSK